MPGQLTGQLAAPSTSGHTAGWRSQTASESLASQMLVIFIALLPFSPLAPLFGFSALPPGFFAILGAMIVTYLLLAELGKAFFFRPQRGVEPLAGEPSAQHRWLRRGGRWARRPTVVL